MAIGKELHIADPDIWRACAGSSVQILTVDSRVYYFPQGHSEQCSCHIEMSSFTQPYYLCKVVALQFLADPNTEEFYTRIHLRPITSSTSSLTHQNPATVSSNGGEKIVSFAKVLTASDANNGGGFSVPRYCAESIFPLLNFSQEPPVQNLVIHDFHGMEWEFRHIYRGTPRRHLLTTGWSKFVNSKKLVAGDSVIFVKDNQSGKIFVGVRRVGRSLHIESSKMDNTHYGFSRFSKSRVSAESIMEVVRFAEAANEFEVVHYPRSGPDFVVNADTVENAMRMKWTPGVRVKMAVETDDSTRKTCIQGTISSTLVGNDGAMQTSPWRMLQVHWDEPDAMQTRVNPWELEIVSTSSQFSIPPPTAKKYRPSPSPEPGTSRDSSLFFPMRGPNLSMVSTQLVPSFLSFDNIPAGMQGARHDTFSPFSNHRSMNTQNFVYSSNLTNTNVSSNLSFIPLRDLGIWGAPQAENPYPQSPSSVHFFSIDLDVQKPDSKPLTNGDTIQLFGKTIYRDKLADGCIPNVGKTENVPKECCKMTKVVEDGRTNSFSSPLTIL